MPLSWLTRVSSPSSTTLTHAHTHVQASTTCTHARRARPRQSRAQSTRTPLTCIHSDAQHRFGGTADGACVRGECAPWFALEVTLQGLWWWLWCHVQGEIPGIRGRAKCGRAKCAARDRGVSREHCCALESSCGAHRPRRSDQSVSLDFQSGLCVASGLFFFSPFAFAGRLSIVHMTSSHISLRFF